MKKNTSRKDRIAHVQDKHRGTSSANPSKIASPCPTPEALTGVQLRQVEVEQLDEQTPSSVGDETNQNVDIPQPNFRGVTRG